jgi:hypothetical protein
MSVRFSTDNAVFAFEDVEDAIMASLSHKIPNDKTIEVYEGIFRDPSDSDPVIRRHLTVKVELSSKLELLDYTFRSAAYAV